MPSLWCTTACGGDESVLVSTSSLCHSGYNNVITFALKMPESYVLIAVYLFICMRVIRKTQKVLNRIA